MAGKLRRHSEIIVCSEDTDNCFRSSLGGEPMQWPLKDHVDQYQDIRQQSLVLQVFWGVILFTG